MPKFFCPNCRAEYDWSPDLAGRKVQCANCGHKFIVKSAPETRPLETRPLDTQSAEPAEPHPAKGLAPLPSAKSNLPTIEGVLLGILVIAVTLVSAWWLFARHAAQNQAKTNPPAASSSADTSVLTEMPPLKKRQVPPCYSGKDLEGIESIVQSAENPTEPWRKEAEERIDKIRKADLNLQVVDAQGHPVKDAEVRVVLHRHKFRFGGVVSTPRMFFQGKPRNEREKKRVEERMATAKLHRTVFLDMGFTAAGFNNALKYKMRRAYEPLLPAAFQWFRVHHIEVRGHCLIWPGRKHLPAELEKLVQSGDKEAVRNYCEKMIAEWASKWNVIEWDVINESRGNHTIQDMLGHEVIADWFKIARKHSVNPHCRLDLNENSVISDRNPGTITENMKRYRAEVEFLLEHDAPVDSIGFQSRFHRMAKAEEIYQRLCWFEDFNFPITATEFEIKTSVGSELDRAVMTERVMTVYFSHRLVDGIFAWTLFPGDGREILNADGTPNLRGKVWLYLMKNRWMTNESLRTAPNGNISLRAFKGEYEIIVTHDGQTKHYRTTLDAPLSGKIIW